LFARPGTKLVVYVTCGDPSPEGTVQIVQAAAEAGADAIELGMPFSEPTADGPAIQAAMQRALARRVGVAATLGVVEQVRAAGCEVPIVLFGYYNPIFVYGVERFCGAAARAGADGVLVVDLPVDEIGELTPAAQAARLDVVPLLAPTSSAQRMARVAALGAPFVYYVSITGVTGAAIGGALDELGTRVREVRAAVQAPVAVGFGIKTGQDARAVAATGADAVVVGSAIVQAIERADVLAMGVAPVNTVAAEQVAELVRSLKGALA
jgi:tryptophan synthase alpha chain